MTANVYVHTKVEKELLRLKEQENTPAFAAKKAEQVINALVKGIKPSQAGKLSRNGDARIRKCLKYDLGKGYRLICIKERKAIYVLYTGSHDSCNTWLDKNRNLKIKGFMAHMNPYRHSPSPHRIVSHNPTKDQKVDNGKSMELDYDEILMEKITQKDLREIFQGFVQ